MPGGVRGTTFHKVATGNADEGCRAAQGVLHDPMEGRGGREGQGDCGLLALQRERVTAERVQNTFVGVNIAGALRNIVENDLAHGVREQAAAGGIGDVRARDRFAVGVNDGHLEGSDGNGLHLGGLERAASLGGHESPAAPELPLGVP